MQPSEVFEEQARACDAMGSPFTAQLCRVLGARLTRDTRTGARVFDWPGNPRSAADNVPLRLCGGLHALVLSGADEALAGTYPPATSEPDADMITAAIARNDDALHDALDSPPQTNEVARAAVLWPALMHIAARHGQPIDLLEFGSSAGLNLNLDRFAYTLGGCDFGDVGSELHLNPDWSGPTLEPVPVTIANRAGVDLSPIDITDPAQRLRLRSYVWADQRERLARLDAALAIADRHPVMPVRGDGLAWIDEQLSKRAADHCTVLFSTVAWQYLPEEERVRGTAIVERHLTDTACPLVWLRMEADSGSRGAAVTLQTTSGTKQLARADFHGRWIDWHPPG